MAEDEKAMIAAEKKLAEKYAKEVSKMFGVNAVAEELPDGAVISINLGKFDNKPDRNKYTADKPNIHSYKFKPTFDALYEFSRLKPLSEDKDIFGTAIDAFAYTSRQMPLKISFPAVRIQSYEKVNGADSWGKDLEKMKPQLAPIIEKAKKQIEDFEAKNEKELTLEQAYQASKGYKLAPKPPQEIVRCAPLCEHGRWR